MGNVHKVTRKRVKLVVDVLIFVIFPRSFQSLPRLIHDLTERESNPKWKYKRLPKKHPCCGRFLNGGCGRKFSHNKLYTKNGRSFEEGTSVFCCFKTTLVVRQSSYPFHGTAQHLLGPRVRRKSYRLGTFQKE